MRVGIGTGVGVVVGISRITVSVDLYDPMVSVVMGEPGIIVSATYWIRRG